MLAVIVFGCANSEESHETPVFDELPTLLSATEAVVDSDSQEVWPGPSETSANVDQPQAAAAITDADRLSCLSQRTRAAQVLMALASEAELAAAVPLASAGDLGGVALLGEPGAGLKQVLAELQLASFVPILVASDEEGGSVQRLGSLLGAIPSAAQIASDRTPSQVRELFSGYAAAASRLGVDVFFGPVVDVGSGPGILSRSFGSDPATVTAYAGAVVQGTLDGGVLPVIKHFPGHGRASSDSHLNLPTTPTIEDIRRFDLLPYKDLLADSRIGPSIGVMVGHLAVPGLSDSIPTSLSPATIDGLLRGELAFDGLVFSDAMNMGAIVNGYGLPHAIELALRAGTDIVILGSLGDVGASLDHLVATVMADEQFAALVDAKSLRVLAAKGQETLCLGAS